MMRTTACRTALAAALLMACAKGGTGRGSPDSREVGAIGTGVRVCDAYEVLARAVIDPIEGTDLAPPARVTSTRGIRRASARCSWRLAFSDGVRSASVVRIDAVPPSPARLEATEVTERALTLASGTSGETWTVTFDERHLEQAIGPADDLGTLDFSDLGLILLRLRKTDHQRTSTFDTLPTVANGPAEDACLPALTLRAEALAVDPEAAQGATSGTPTPIPAVQACALDSEGIVGLVYRKPTDAAGLRVHVHPAFFGVYPFHLDIKPDEGDFAMLDVVVEVQRDR